MTPAYIQPSSVIEIIDTAVLLYRRHLKLFVGIAILYSIVDALHVSVFLFLWQPPDALVESFINYFVSAIGMGICIVAANETYQDRQITIGTTLRQFWRILPPYLAATTGYIITILLPDIFSEITAQIGTLITPMGTLIILLMKLLSYPICIYYIIAWFLYGPVIICETSQRTIKPLYRSRKIVAGAWWKMLAKTTGVFLFMIAIFSICFISVAVALKTLGVMGTDTFEQFARYIWQSISQSHQSTQASIATITIEALMILTNAFITPVYAISVLLLYFSRTADTSDEKADLQTSNELDTKKTNS